MIAFYFPPGLDNTLPPESFCITGAPKNQACCLLSDLKRWGRQPLHWGVLPVQALACVTSCPQDTWMTFQSLRLEVRVKRCHQTTAANVHEAGLYRRLSILHCYMHFLWIVTCLNGDEQSFKTDCISEAFILVRTASFMMDGFIFL